MGSRGDRRKELSDIFETKYGDLNRNNALRLAFGLFCCLDKATQTIVNLNEKVAELETSGYDDDDSGVYPMTPPLSPLASPSHRASPMSLQPPKILIPMSPPPERVSPLKGVSPLKRAATLRTPLMTPPLQHEASSPPPMDTRSQTSLTLPENYKVPGLLSGMPEAAKTNEIQEYLEKATSAISLLEEKVINLANGVKAMELNDGPYHVSTPLTSPPNGPARVPLKAKSGGHKMEISSDDPYYVPTPSISPPNGPAAGRPRVPPRPPRASGGGGTPTLTPPPELARGPTRQQLAFRAELSMNQDETAMLSIPFNNPGDIDENSPDPREPLVFRFPVDSPGLPKARNFTEETLYKATSAINILEGKMINLENNVRSGRMMPNNNGDVDDEEESLDKKAVWLKKQAEETNKDKNLPYPVSLDWWEIQEYEKGRVSFEIDVGRKYPGPVKQRFFRTKD